MLRWTFLSLFLGACGAPAIAASPRPDGGWHLKCGSSLAGCVPRAEDLCKGRGYVVLGGMSKRKIYGAELGASQVEVREAELDIACADRRGELPTVAAVSAPPPATLQVDGQAPK